MTGKPISAKATDIDSTNLTSNNHIHLSGVRLENTCTRRFDQELRGNICGIPLHCLRNYS